MLLQATALVEPRGSRRWSLLAVGGLLTLALLVAGVGRAVQAAPAGAGADETKKEEPKKENPKKEQPAGEELKKELKKEDSDKLSDLIDEMLKQMPVGTNPDIVKQMRERMERNLHNMTPDQIKQMREHMAKGGVGNPFGPPGGLPPGGMMPPGMGGRPNPRLGARVETPGATLAEQMDLPKGQGLVVRDVPADSAAAKAGLKPHDILLELNGKPVPDRVEGLNKLMADIKPDATVEAVVLRKGKKETIKELKLPKAKAVPLDAPGFGPPAGFQPPGDFVPPRNFPGVGGGLPAIGGIGGFLAPDAGGRTVMTTLFRTQDRFTLRHQEGSLVITLTGKTTDGKVKVSNIHVQDGRESNKYESADKVPEPYRDKVKNLIEMSEKSSGRIEIKTP